MRDRRARSLLAALCLVTLALGGCGDVRVEVVEGSSGGQRTRPPTAGDQPAGLWDPSPYEAGEVRGPLTYAFKPAPAGVAPRRGGEVSLGYLQDIDSFNPFLSSSVAASDVQDMVFTRLMYEQPDYYDGVPTFTPRLAERWEVAPDNLSIRFWLREARWSDGTPITADDVAYAVEAARSPDVAWVGASIVDFIQGVEVHAPREFTVRYSLSQPYNIMDINDVMVVPKHAFGRVPFAKWREFDGWHDIARTTAGGPWRLADYTPGQRMVLAPNPNYWEVGKPYLERVVIQIFGNMDSMLNAVLAGQLDVMSGVSPEKANRVKETSHTDLYSHVSRVFGYIGWNCRRFPFDDARVRRAMTYAINRANIVESLFEGHAAVAGPFIIRSMWASARHQPPYPYDPGRAEALLAEAGWRRGADGVHEKDGRPLRFTVVTNKGNTVRKQIFEAMQADLQAIGVRAELDQIDFNQMSEQLKRHNFACYIGAWSIATKIDPKPTWHSVSVEGRHNYVNFIHPRIDELIDQGRILDVGDPSIRNEARNLWHEFQAILYAEQPYTMVYEARALVAIARRFVNVRVTAGHAYENIHEWWVADGADPAAGAGEGG